MKNVSSKTLGLVQVSLLGAIIVVMAVLPVLGYIPLGFMNATIIHIPVIIASIVLGPKKGAILGLLFGITSLCRSTFAPNLTSFVFSPFYKMGDIGGSPLSLIVSLVPRTLVGVVPYYVYKGLVKLFKGKKGTDSLAVIIAGIAGSMTNTLLVMNFIYLFFGKSYSAAKLMPQITELITTNLPKLADEKITALAHSVVNALVEGADAAAILVTAGIPSGAVEAVLSGINMSASNLYNTIVTSTIFLVGVPEAIVAAIITLAIVKPLMKFNKNK